MKNPTKQSLFFLKELRIENAAINYIYAKVKNDIKEFSKDINEAVESGDRRVEGIVYTLIMHAAADLLVSGQFCIYRGLLSPNGESLFKCYDNALSNLLKIGDIDEAFLEQEKKGFFELLSKVG